jgi:hypothetical protein
MHRALLRRCWRSGTLIHRARSAPTQEALQIQRLFGIRGGGVDIPSLASALALPTSEASAVVGIAVINGDQPAPLMAEIAAALRLLACPMCASH